MKYGDNGDSDFIRKKLKMHYGNLNAYGRLSNVELILSKREGNVS